MVTKNLDKIMVKRTPRIAHRNILEPLDPVITRVANVKAVRRDEGLPEVKPNSLDIIPSIGFVTISKIHSDDSFELQVGP